MTDQSRSINEDVCVATWSVSFGNAGSTSNRATPETYHWTVKNISPNGKDVVYAEFDSENDFDTFGENDPLWEEGMRQLFDHLLSNPNTRDTVIKINMQAALERGDTELCAKLAQGLSPQAFDEIFGDVIQDSTSGRSDK